MNSDEPNRPSVLETVDEFITAVPWGRWRMVLVYRRQHGGHTYVRFRIWNKHRLRAVWYPSRRYFVIPERYACLLATALQEAVRGETSQKPDWLIAREDAENEALDRLGETGLSEESIDQARQSLTTDRRNRI